MLSVAGVINTQILSVSGDVDTQILSVAGVIDTQILSVSGVINVGMLSLSNQISNPVGGSTNVALTMTKVTNVIVNKEEPQKQGAAKSEEQNNFWQKLNLKRHSIS